MAVERGRGVGWKRVLRALRPSGSPLARALAADATEEGRERLPGSYEAVVECVAEEEEA
jgi:hypothetical protein